MSCDVEDPATVAHLLSTDNFWPADPNDFDAIALLGDKGEGEDDDGDPLDNNQGPGADGEEDPDDFRNGEGDPLSLDNDDELASAGGLPIEAKTSIPPADTKAKASAKPSAKASAKASAK
jgi:hypothetical protein